jgi:predicted DNA-binding protein YlxM (UPF0122 family)
MKKINQNQINAVKKANTGKVLSHRHKLRIKRGMRKTNKHCVIIAENDSEKLMFKSMAECARHLDCSRQLISQCIKRPNQFLSAKGYTISLYDYEEKPLTKQIRKLIEK